MAKDKRAADVSFRQLINFVPSSGQTSHQNEKKKARKSEQSRTIDRLGKEAKAFYEDLLSKSTHKGPNSPASINEKQVSSSSGNISGGRIRKRMKTVHCAKSSETKSLENDKCEQEKEFFNPQTLNPNHRQHFKLLQSVQLGNVKEVEDLLKSGLNVNFQDFYGWTPLMCAANEGHANVVKVLLEAGAGRSLRNSTGDNASTLAMNAGYPKVVELIRTFETRQRLELEDSQKSSSSSSIKEKTFYCEICKQEFCVKEQKCHYSSTVHLFNCGKKNSGPAFLIPQTNRGFQMLLRSGWTGDSGLGPEGKGSTYPVKTVLKQDRRGFGDDQESKKKAKITHFNAKDERAIQIKIETRRDLSVRTLARNAQKLKAKRGKKREKYLRYEFS